MNIGMILDYTFPPDPRVQNEAISLVSAGHNVYLFCLSYGDQPIEEEIHQIKLRRYLWNKFVYKMSALAYTFPFYHQVMKPKLAHFLVSNGIEAIHIHDMRIAAAVFKVNENLKLPVVLDLHDNMPEIMKLYPHLQKFPGKQLISPKKWKLAEEAFIRKADRVITVSQEFVDEVVERTKIDRSKMILVPNTVHRSFYKEAKINDEIVKRYQNDFVILYLGDTGLRRGLQTAIEACVELSNSISNLKLVIVGKNTSDTILKQQVKELNLESIVDFEGWQDVALFPSYIVASTICISPLQRNIQHDVAYANKLFQYMSFGKPVLVSDAIAQKRLIERTKSGLVHHEKDPHDFAVKVRQLFFDQKLILELGCNGKRFIEDEFCWEKTSEKLIQLYENLND